MGGASAEFAVLGATSVLVVLLVVLRATRRRACQRDPQRAFTTAQRLAGFRRAGNQCEHKRLFLPRCTAAPNHGDHVYPWSRGGSTTLANFAALCARHNLAKSSTILSAFAIRRLEKRRRSYFPPGERGEVVWKIGDRRP